MSNSHSKSSGTQSIAPSSFEIYQILLTMNNSNKDVIDIKNLVNEITINESLFSSSIEVEMRILDATNLFELTRLSGGEEIEIKLFRVIDPSTTFAEAKSKMSIKVNIAEIKDLNKKSVGTQLYTLICYSTHTFNNSLKKISRAFNGVPNALISDICKRDLGLKDLEPFTNKNTNPIQGIYPNLKPLSAINWILRNCAGEDNTPLYFYETVQGGLQFNSYSELLEQETYMTYNDQSFIDSPKDTETYDIAATKIRDMTSKFDISIYDLINKGTFASNIQSLDISTKDYKNIRYRFKGTPSLNEFPPLSNELSFNNTLLKDADKSHEYFINKNAKAFTDTDNYHNPLEGLLADKQSYYNALSYMNIDLILNGDFNLSSGKYLVTSIAHIFTMEEYTCDIGIQKDSVLFDMNEKLKSIESSDNKSTGVLTNG